MRKPFDIRIGERIYELRVSHGLSQRQLAKVVNISRDSIRDWELQKTYPSLTAVTSIVDFFDVPADYLLGIHLDHWIHIGHLSSDQQAVVQHLISVFEKTNKDLK